ncbi:MAG: CDGSH iron-sulfur domain-containing protein [Planctomycetes bacterium]|nr:CDGSH iron-sulfur domain-containing protein [Planctomycetota bacterium]
MSNVTIRVRDNGPLLIEGSIRVEDGEGNPFPLDASKPQVALCRCGNSKNGPFCDGSHKTTAFASAPRAALR